MNEVPKLGRPVHERDLPTQLKLILLEVRRQQLGFPVGGLTSHVIAGQISYADPSMAWRTNSRYAAPVENRCQTRSSTLSDCAVPTTWAKHASPECVDRMSKQHRAAPRA